MNAVIAALFATALAADPAVRVDQVVVSNPEATNVQVDVTCDYPVYRTVVDVTTNVFREALPDGTYMWRTNIWRVPRTVVSGHTPRYTIASYSAEPGHSVLTNAGSQVDIVEGMRVFADAGPAKVTLAYAVATSGGVIEETDPTVPAWAKEANPPEGMTDNALVLTNGAVKTKIGTAVTPANIGAASASSVADLQTSKLDATSPTMLDSRLWWNEEGFLVYSVPVNGDYWNDAYFSFTESGFLQSSRGFACGTTELAWGSLYETSASDWSWIINANGNLQGTLDLKIDGSNPYGRGGVYWSDDIFIVDNCKLLVGYGSALMFNDDPEYPDETIDERIVRLAPAYVPSATDPTFSNAVLAVSIDTNTVAQIGELNGYIHDYGELGATSVGGLILALLSAVAWLKKNKFDTANVSAANGTFRDAVAACFDNGDTTNYPRS